MRRMKQNAHKKMKISREVQQAAAALRRGGIVAFPTETVWGIGAIYCQPKAVKKIFKAKGRPSDNPLIVHIADQKELSLIAQSVPEKIIPLLKKFWPGPLTVILPKSESVPQIVTAGLDTVAVRMPKHTVARALIRAAGAPIAAPSANRSGRPSATEEKHVRQDLAGRVDQILSYKGSARYGLESTVVDATTDPIQILRPGWVTLQDVRRLIPDAQLYVAQKNIKAVRSPGLKHRHYQPRCRVVLVAAARWQKTLQKISEEKIGIIECGRRSKMIHTRTLFYRNFRSTAAFARRIFSALLAAENAGVTTLYIKTLRESGLAIAVMDRLKRASSRVVQ